jgi:hypothetical protein
MKALIVILAFSGALSLLISLLYLVLGPNIDSTRGGLQNALRLVIALLMSIAFFAAAMVANILLGLGITFGL